jgi:hypothetical protein
MLTPRKSPIAQLAILFATAALWYGIIVAAALVWKASGRGFFDSLPTICIFLILVAPVFYIYFLFRVAQTERPFFAKHRIIFGAAVALAIAPFMFLCFLFFMPYL